MKKTFLILFISILSLGGYSQDISGKWVGKLYQGEGGVRSTYNFMMKLTSDNQGNITGFSEISFTDDPDVYGIILLEGKFKEKKFSFSESEISEQNIKNDLMKWCIKTGNLAYTEKEGKAFLMGKWDGGKTCSPGTIILSKPIELATNEFVREEKSGTTIEVNSNYLELEIFDFGKQDGDTISLILNDKPILVEHLLTLKHFKLKIKLEQGRTHKLVLLAHNLGKLPPNTAKVIINDGVIKKTIRLSSNMNESDIIYLKIKQ